MYTCDSSTGCSKVLQLRNLDIDPLDIKMTAVKAPIRSKSTSFYDVLHFGHVSDSRSMIYPTAKWHPNEERGVLEF